MSRLDDWRAAGREVSVAGLARSGIAAARLLAARGVPSMCRIAATADVLHAAAEALRSEAGARVTVRPRRARPRADSAQRRPGTLAGNPAGRSGGSCGNRRRRTGARRSTAWTGRDDGGRLPIVVTGTNGKTTTTALVDHLLRAAGRRSVAAGNIGNPLSAVALATPRPDWLAVELSSFQLHDCPDLAPTVGILTNLAPDHLDRYPSLAAYYADKAQIVRQCRTRRRSG